MKRNLLSLLGPGFVTASLVLGPGSVTVATKAGALFGYSLLWCLVPLWVFMITYTAASARIGVLCPDTLMQALAARFGRLVAALMGLSGFLICCSFQTGDVIGVSASLSAVLGVPETWFKILFPVICIALYYFSPNAYKLIERLMLFLVVVMVVAFVSNLFLARPSLGGIAAGFVPRIPLSKHMGLLTAMSATNFVIAAAFYQSYLVREKAYAKEDAGVAGLDSVAGITVLFALVGVITITSAAVLQPRGIVVNSAADMAVQLEPLLGTLAKYLFCAGLFAASFSSLAVNALTGGTMLSDGLGKGASMRSPWVKAFASVIMLFGVVMSLLFGGTPVQAIVLVQQLTLLTVPFLGLSLIWAANSARVVGDRRNRWWQNVVMLAGYAVVLWLFWNVVKTLLS